MANTRDQSLAFIEALNKSPKVHAHLEAALGWDCVPETKDFDSQDAEELERCEDLLEYLKTVRDCLYATLKERPRQKTLEGLEV
jgi:hypothetical protein